MTLNDRLRRHREMRVFSTPKGQNALRALIVGEAIFDLEKRLRRELVDQIDVELVLPNQHPTNLNGLGAHLSDLVSSVMMEDVTFCFHESKGSVKNIRTPVDLTPTGAVCLFSGGVDSFVGFDLALSRSECSEGVFCAHSDYSKIIRTATDLFADEFEARGARLRRVAVPAIGKGAYAQLRGFLYILSAAAWAELLSAERIVVTEVGPTMYQPKFAPFDRVTLTTHPHVVEAALIAAETVLKRNISLVMPFEDLTKAEVMALAPKPEKLRLTHSCISQRFSLQDGTCYGCVVRRLASEAAGIVDASYRADPVLQEAASQGNLLALLRFSLDFLRDPSTMEEFEVGEIEAFGKHDLFRRFALDNFAALYSVRKREGRLAANVETIYRQAVAYVKEDIFRERLVELRREKSFAPDWSVRPRPKLV